MKQMELAKVGWLMFLIIGCTTAPKKAAGPNFSDLAPASMAPPSFDTGNPTVDPLYLRSQADYHYTLAEAYSYEGKSQKAIEEFKLTLIYDNKSPSIRSRLATEYMRLGMTSEAIEQAEASAAQNPQSIAAKMLLGTLYTTIKVYDKAAKQYQSILEIEPKNLEAPTYQAGLEAEQGHYDEAIVMFRKLGERKDNPNRAMSYYYEARIWMEKSNWKQAEKAFGRSIELKPDFDDAVLALSQVYRAQNKNKQMLTLLRSFEQQYGPHHEIAQELSDYYLSTEDFTHALEQLDILQGFERDNLNVKVKIALIEIEQKQFQRAAKHLDEILEDAPESDKIRFYAGAVHEELQQPAAAIADYRAVPATSQYYGDSVIHAAYLMRRDHAKEARALVEEALQKRQDLPNIYAYYATVLDDDKDYRQAVSMLQGALERFATNTQLRFYLGTMYDRLNKTDEAIGEMKRVLDIDENYVQALNFLAYTYAETNHELATAEKLANKALAQQPHDGFILDTMGWVLFKQGRFEESVKYLESAYHEKSSESVIAEHLGDVYYRLQLVDKAKKMYRRAMETEQNEQKVRQIESKMAAIDHPDIGPIRAPATH